MRRSAIAIACIAWVCACGARTGLDAGSAPERDAALPFDTFPCSWSWGIPYEIARGGDYSDLRGAVHGVRDEVFVMAASAGEVAGARLTLTSPPRLVASYALAPDDHDVAGRPSGWATLSGCRLTLRDDDLVPLRVLDAAPATPRALECDFAPVEARYIDVRVIHDMGFAGIRHDERGELVASCGVAVLPSATFTAPMVIRGPSGVCASAWIEDGELVLQREDGVGARLGSASTFAMADDTLRPAALIVRGVGGQLNFARVPFEGAPIIDDLMWTTADPDEPLQVVTNETEALVPLDDGSLAVQPLSGSALRFLPPPETTGRIDTLRLIMRPSTSVGGALYVIRDGDQRALRFAPLSCNR